MKKTLLYLSLLLCAQNVSADPCGMVPPISIAVANADKALLRTGPQRTYMFFRDGMETIALRPGFQGKVDNFGMLIPFPSPPAIRKIDDSTFSQIEAAIDPPRVNVYLQRSVFGHLGAKGIGLGGGGIASAYGGKGGIDGLKYNEVRVLNQEAVGMYQVAVLEAGSSNALKKWMDENGYRYPTGMDKVADEYVAAHWCFVAVKSTVGQAAGVKAKPGMKTVDSKLPSGASFDGHVQGMAFRFRTKEPVIPMRLSVFNGEDPRNVVYALAEKALKINNLSEELVLRQIDGEQLHHNLTRPLSVEYHNGTKAEVRKEQDIQRIKNQRNVAPYNRIAREMFASDLLALRQHSLSLPHEEVEKELLRISESFGLRGKEIDALQRAALQKQLDIVSQGALDDLREMHISVIDGVYSGEVLARENLSFSEFTMPKEDNTRRNDTIRARDISLYVQLN